MSSSDIATNKTIVLTDPEDIMKSAAGLFSNVKQRIDCAADSNAPYSHILVKPVRDGFIQIKNRGVKVRFITEITKENLYYSKELMKIVELRHLDGIKGNFGIADGREYRASPTSKQDQTPPEYIISTVKSFVEQQQYFFDMLWSRAIPAKQRIREIEEGYQEEFFKVIDDPETAAEIYTNLAKSIKTSAHLLLPNSKALVMEYKLGVLECLTDASKNKDVRDIRIICSVDDKNSQIIRWLNEEAPNITIINTTTNLATKLLIVNDDTLFRAELRDPDTDTFSKALSFAIYSNSKPTVGAFKSFFELVWDSYTTNMKLRQADKVQREFINIAAHELRTPIVPILGFSEVLYSKVKERLQKVEDRQEELEQLQEEKEMLEIILRNADRLHQLTEDILDVTRIESQTLKLRKERFNVNELILEVIEDSRKRVANGNVKLMHELVDNNSAVIVEADRRRLTQVISNLLDNAIKFTKEGTITITSTIRRKMADGDNTGRVGKEGAIKQQEEEGEQEVVIGVKDTGSGIDPELMPRLFTKFTTKSYQGTGLGLFISKGIIEAHSGKMWARNNYQNGSDFDKQLRGATFFFTLPVVSKIELTAEEKKEAKVITDQQPER